MKMAKGWGLHKKLREKRTLSINNQQIYETESRKFLDVYTCIKGENY